MRTLTFLLMIFFLSACAYHGTKTVDEQMETCKEGYMMALNSDIPDLTENVIFQITLKRMNGLLNNSTEIENTLARLAIEGREESTRRKASLALSYLICRDDVCKTEIKADYHDQEKIFGLLETYLRENTEIRDSSE